MDVEERKGCEGKVRQGFIGIIVRTVPAARHLGANFQQVGQNADVGADADHRNHGVKGLALFHLSSRIQFEASRRILDLGDASQGKAGQNVFHVDQVALVPQVEHGIGQVRVYAASHRVVDAVVVQGRREDVVRRVAKGRKHQADMVLSHAPVSFDGEGCLVSDAQHVFRVDVRSLDAVGNRLEIRLFEIGEPHVSPRAYFEGIGLGDDQQ